MCNEGAVVVCCVLEDGCVLLEGVGDTRNRLELGGSAPPVGALDDVDTVLEPTSIGSSFLGFESFASSSSLMSSNCEKRPDSVTGTNGRFSFSLPLW